jgi:hypothetical protein
MTFLIAVFLRFRNGEKPPPIAFSPAPGLPVKIDFHGAAGGRGDLEPVLANIQFATAVASFSGFTPGAQYGRNLDGSTSPLELTRKPGLSGGHPRGVICGAHRSDDFTDESLVHDY